MLSHSSEAPQAVTSPEDVAASGKPAPAGRPAGLDPRRPIEVLSGGTGTLNDPSGTDRQPPGVTEPSTSV